MPSSRRVFLLCAALVMVATGCRVDMDIAVVMNADGSGDVTVRVVADAAVVQAAPDAVNGLLTDDLLARGWVVDGPTIADDGSASVAITAPFDDATGLGVRLGDIGVPILTASADRTVTADQTRADNQVQLTLGVPGGFSAFADTDLVEVLGGQPFADDLAEVDPADALTIDVYMTLPGSIADTDGTVDTATAVVSWNVPADGTTVSAMIQSVQDTSTGPSTMARVADVLGVVLVVWVAVSGAFIVWVVVARRRRAVAR